MIVIYRARRSRRGIGRTSVLRFAFFALFAVQFPSPFFKQLVAVWMIAMLIAPTFTIPARANPVGEQVVAGSAGFNRDGSTLTVNQGSDRAIINWQDFSIGSSELTRFMQPSASSAALNRVITGNPSSLLGTLQANGQIYLINPNGILVGGGARIDCASFIASTLDIANDAFMSGGNLNFVGASATGIQNLGSINAIGGDVFLIARTVENQGTISAPDGVVGLAAGEDVLLTQAGDSRLTVQLATRHSPLATQNGIDNAGLIEAAQAELKAAGGNIYALAIYNDGIIRATGITEKNGRVILAAEGGSVISSGTIVARTPVGGFDEAAPPPAGSAIPATTENGGEVRITGDWVGLGGTVDASGVSGGTVDIQAGGLSLAGEIAARGGEVASGQWRVASSESAGSGGQPAVDDGLSTVDGVSGNGGTVTIHVDRKTVETSSSVIDVSGANGGSITHLAGQQIMSSGAYRAVGGFAEAAPSDPTGSATPSTGHGGKIDISAPATKLLSANIDASGTGDGGQIRIGGEFQGGKNLATDPPSQGDLARDEIPNAQILAVSSGTRITADGGVGAAASGDGGTVILWADERAVVYGDISAQGTRHPALDTQHSSGGFVEISSGDSLTFGGTVDTGGGTVLFDPKNIYINTTGTGTLGSGGTGLSQYSLVLGYNYQAVPGFNTTLEANDGFGLGLSVDGQRLAVGALWDDGAGNAVTDAGAVYLFTFSDSAFNNPKLEGILGKGYVGGKNVNVAVLEASDTFGGTVSLDGARLAVGAPNDDGAGNLASGAGAVYLFSFSDSVFSGGTLEATIGKGYTGGKNLDVVNVETRDSFGYGLSLDGTRLAVGAPSDDGFGNVASAAGVAYLFSFADSLFATPVLEATVGKGYTGGKNFDLSALEAGDESGYSVALNGNRLAVGAHFDDGFGNTTANVGAVYLLSFADSVFTTPVLQGTLGKGYTGGKNLDITALESGDQFGRGVGLDGNRLAVGAPFDDGSGNTTANAGAAYLFSFADSVFTGPVLEATVGKRYTSGKNFAVSGLEASDLFGTTVSVDGNHLAVGAYQDDGAGNAVANSGAVYFFNLNSGGNGLAPFTQDQSSDFTLSAATLASALAAPQNVTLQANNDIYVNAEVTVNNLSGNGGALTLQAGRDVHIRGSITTDNGNLTIIANETAANGVVDAQRDGGWFGLADADITVASGVTLNAGTGSVAIEMRDGAGLTHHSVGRIELASGVAGVLGMEPAQINGSTISIVNPMASITGGGKLTASGSGDAVVLVGNQVAIAPGNIALTGSGRYLIYATDPGSVNKTGAGLFFEQFGGTAFAYPNAPDPIFDAPTKMSGFLYSSEAGTYDDSKTHPSSSLVFTSFLAALVDPILLSEAIKQPSDSEKAAFLPYATMSDAIYGNLSLDEWKLLFTFSDPSSTSGLQAGVYRSQKPGDNTQVLAFRGTEFTQANDWATDKDMIGGGQPLQYTEAKNIADRLNAQANSNGQSLLMTGHSLGGGLATYVGLALERPAYVFNPAPMGIGIQALVTPAQLAKHSDLVDNVSVEGDKVSRWPPLQPGDRFLLDVDGLGPYAAHRIGEVVSLLKPVTTTSTESSFFSSLVSFFSTPSASALTQEQAEQAIAANLTTTSTSVQEQAADTANNRSALFTSTETVFGAPPPLITFVSGDSGGLTLGGGAAGGILGGASSFNTPPAGEKRR